MTSEQLWWHQSNLNDIRASKITSELPRWHQSFQDYIRATKMTSELPRLHQSYQNDIRDTNMTSEQLRWHQSFQTVINVYFSIFSNIWCKCKGTTMSIVWNFIDNHSTKMVYKGIPLQKRPQFCLTKVKEKQSKQSKQFQSKWSKQISSSWCSYHM